MTGRAPGTAGDAPPAQGEPVVHARHDGAIIAAPSLSQAPEDWWFDPAAWAQRGLLAGAGGGRGSVAFVEAPTAGAGARWVLRPYRRGGLVRHILRAHYLFVHAEGTRVFREFRLLHALYGYGFPVPRPVAGAFVRHGPWWYAAALITEQLSGFEPLSGRLATPQGVSRAAWEQIGATLRRLFDAGVHHADLNAHNVLLDSAGRCRIIDFDRGRFEPRTPLTDRARTRTLHRLERSLRKLGYLPQGAASDGWQACVATARARD